MSAEHKNNFSKNLEYTSNVQVLRENNERLVNDLNRYSSEIKILHVTIGDLESKLDEKSGSLVQKDKLTNELKTMLLE